MYWGRTGEDVRLRRDKNEGDEGTETSTKQVDLMLDVVNCGCVDELK